MKKLITLLLLSLIPIQANAAITKVASTMLANNTSGAIFAFAGSTCPTGSVAADGSSLLRAGTYANLFTAISTSWGSADGTHFNVPNLIGRALKGAGTITDGHGGTSVSLGSFQDHATAVNGLSASQASHTHTLWAADNANSSFPNSSQAVAYQGTIGNSNDYAMRFSALSPTVGISSSAQPSVTVSSSDTETRPKAYGVNFCIWY